MNRKKIDKIMESHGFYIWDTGGGCQAYVRTEIIGGVKHEFMLTDIGGLDLPTNLNHLSFGHYIDQTTRSIDSTVNTTFKEVIKYINICKYAIEVIECINSCTRSSLSSMSQTLFPLAFLH